MFIFSLQFFFLAGKMTPWSKKCHLKQSNCECTDASLEFRGRLLRLMGKDCSCDSLTGGKGPILTHGVCSLDQRHLVKLLLCTLPIVRSFRGKKTSEDAQQNLLLFNPVCQSREGKRRAEDKLYFLWWGVFIHFVLIQRNNLLFSFMWNQLLPWNVSPTSFLSPSGVHPCRPRTGALAAAAGMLQACPETCPVSAFCRSLCEESATFASHGKCWQGHCN